MEQSLCSPEGRSPAGAVSFAQDLRISVLTWSGLCVQLGLALDAAISARWVHLGSAQKMIEVLIPPPQEGHVWVKLRPIA